MQSFGSQVADVRGQQDSVIAAKRLWDQKMKQLPDK